MEKKYDKLKMFFTPCVSFVIAVSILILAGSFFSLKFLNFSREQIAEIIFWNIEYFFVFALSLEMYKHGDFLDYKKLLPVLGLFAISFAGILVSGHILIFNFWMLGTVLLGVYLHPYIGIAFQLILTYSYCIVNGFGITFFICYFTLGALLILFSRFMDKLIPVFFILLLLVAANGAFILILNQFQLDDPSQFWMELISTVLMTLLIYGIQSGRENKTLKEKKDKVLKKKAVNTSKKAAVSYPMDEEIIEEIKKFSYSLYKHSSYIGNLSQRAANVLGGNGELARIGGLYHEFGRLDGKNYVESGVRRLQRHKVPKEIVKVVEEHNINYKMPTSKEAVAVMLTDSIVTTLQYLEKKKGKKIQVDKVIRSFFAKRSEMTIFSENGISEEEVKALENYYLDIFGGLNHDN